MDQECQLGNASPTLTIVLNPPFHAPGNPALPTRSQGCKRAVKALSAGDVFGEVALLTKAPRQADCVAASRQGRGGAWLLAGCRGCSCWCQGYQDVWLSPATSCMPAVVGRRPLIQIKAPAA